MNSMPLVWLAASMGANVILLVLFIAFALSRSDPAKSAPAAAAESDDDRTWETRIERLDVLWYPVVHYAAASKKVLKTVAGVPYCKACALALSSKSGKGWACPQCQNHFSESLVDVSVLDLISKQALRFFLERHKDYRVS